MPSYEERLVQMEPVLKNSVTNNYYDLRYVVYDVLLTFFNHDDPMVRLAAYEVYIRCAYKAYNLLSLDYKEGDTLDDGEVPTVVTWRFNLGHSHSPSDTLRIAAGGPPLCSASPVHTGTIASFPNVKAMAKGFDKVVSMLPSFDGHEFSERYGANSQAPNIVNIALRIFLFGCPLIPGIMISTTFLLKQRIMEAGQVWYPNSAYKTTQAIFDFNREGLPLIIFANWRGFSGGQQDMYDEILKQGSKIVDGLSSYKQLVFVYIVPNGELRGGAWVVLDPSINSEQMEMYADVNSRAGVLEPEGIIKIKMCCDKILALMERLNSTYASFKCDSKDTSKSPEQHAAATAALAERETLLQPTYKQIALLYADLHEADARGAGAEESQCSAWEVEVEAALGGTEIKSKNGVLSSSNSGLHSAAKSTGGSEPASAEQAKTGASASVNLNGNLLWWDYPKNSSVFYIPVPYAEHGIKTKFKETRFPLVSFVEPLTMPSKTRSQHQLTQQLRHRSLLCTGFLQHRNGSGSARDDTSSSLDSHPSVSSSSSSSYTPRVRHKHPRNGSVFRKLATTPASDEPQFAPISQYQFEPGLDTRNEVAPPSGARKMTELVGR
ncbi:hypothetical protein CVT25_005329, partial [Psilocybe cyanescens]